MNIKDLPMTERPMERLLAYGASSLSNVELLALIIRTGSGNESAIGLSERILSSLDGGLSGLMTVTPQELMKLPGIGSSKASALCAIGELLKRIGKSNYVGRRDISSADDVAGMFMETLRFERKEHFQTVLLDTKGKIIHVEEVSVGDLNTAPVHPREVFTSAVRRSAASIILIHNHPSGDPAPSGSDSLLTERLVEVGKLLGIKVLDHVIIGDGDYYSFAGAGKI